MKARKQETPPELVMVRGGVCPSQGLEAQRAAPCEQSERNMGSWAGHVNSRPGLHDSQGGMNASPQQIASHFDFAASRSILLLHTQERPR